MAKKVRDVDHGAKELRGRLRRGVPRGRVGVYGDKASAAAKDAPGRTVGEIAAAHEFGLGAVPMRSWLRGTMDQRRSQISSALAEIVIAVISRKRGAPNVAAEKMAQLTQAAAGWCRERIAAGIAPALSERYLPRKLRKYPGATTPLIASGQMRQSIAGEIEAKK